MVAVTLNPKLKAVFHLQQEQQFPWIENLYLAQNLKPVL